MTEPPGSIVLEIPNSIDALSAGIDRVAAFLETWSVGPGDRADILVIIDEIGSNIIKAAWPGGGEHAFSLELDIGGDPRQIVLVARDDGVAFDPTGAAPPDLALDLDDLEPGGLGLFMVGEISDSLDYARIDGRNVLTIMKRLAPPVGVGEPK